MKHRIKIVLTLVAAFLIVNTVFKSSSNPEELAFNVQSLVYRVQYIAGLIKPEQILNQSLKATVAQTPLVTQTKADERRVIEYKGKQITIITNDPSIPLSDEMLEFFYQIELEKERQGIK